MLSLKEKGAKDKICICFQESMLQGLGRPNCSLFHGFGLFYDCCRLWLVLEVWQCLIRERESTPILEICR